jgi:hypothetical protein
MLEVGAYMATNCRGRIYLLLPLYVSSSLGTYLCLRLQSNGMHNSAWTTAKIRVDREASWQPGESPDFMTRGNREGRLALEHKGIKTCNMHRPSLHFFRMSAAMVCFAVRDSNTGNMA